MAHDDKSACQEEQGKEKGKKTNNYGEHSDRQPGRRPASGHLSVNRNGGQTASQGAKIGTKDKKRYTFRSAPGTDDITEYQGT